MDIIQTIKSRVNLIDYIGRTTKLLPASKGYKKALCPFHNEKSPSFGVNPTFYHCFGCGESGDIFSYIQKKQGVDFKEALKLLCEELGIENNDYNKYRDAFELNLSIAVTYQKKLYENEKYIKYLIGRGLTEKTIRDYMIGYSPPGIAPHGKFLNQMETLGIIKYNGINIFDGRIVIPIFSASGDVIAFSGRSMNGEDPKYTNTFNNFVYNKSRDLYGLNKSKHNIVLSKTVVIVEGYFDHIFLHQSGIKNSVAICGTSITKEAMSTLRCMSNTVYLIPDNDEAGIESIKKNYIMLAQKYQRIKIVLVDCDPDEFVQKNCIKNIEEVDKMAVDADEFFLQKVYKKNDKNHKKSVADVNDLINKLPLVTSTIIKDKLSVRLGKQINYINSQKSNNIKLEEMFVKLLITNHCDIINKFLPIIKKIIISPTLQPIVSDILVTGEACIDLLPEDSIKEYNNIIALEYQCSGLEEVKYILNRLIDDTYKKLIKSSDILFIGKLVSEKEELQSIVKSST